MLFIVVSGVPEKFFKKLGYHFFSGQLVSAQRLSAVFQFRFFFVANLKFKRFAWHGCLEFLFDKTGLMKL